MRKGLFYFFCDFENFLKWLIVIRKLWFYVLLRIDDDNDDDDLGLLEIKVMMLCFLDKVILLCSYCEINYYYLL